MFSFRQEVFSVFISWKGWDIEIGNMYQQYLVDKKIWKFKDLDLWYEDIVALWEYLSNELKLPISKLENEAEIDWNIALWNAFVDSWKLSYKKEIHADLADLIKPYSSKDFLNK